MPRPFQFSLRALLVAMLVVAAFFGGMAVQRQLSSPKEPAVRMYPLIGPARLITLPDGTKHFETVPVETE